MALSEQRELSSRKLSLSRVLVVEDHPDGREILRTLLELMGYDVEVASDGEEGVARALARPPDVALVDIGLPLLDGYEVAKKLRACFGHRVFLIAQTGYGQPQDRVRAFESGFDAHLVKPLSLEDLSYWLAVAAEPREADPSGPAEDRPGPRGAGHEEGE